MIKSPSDVLSNAHISQGAKPEQQRRKFLKRSILLSALVIGATGPFECTLAQIADRVVAGREPLFAYVGSRTTRERNAKGDGINVYRVDPETGNWTHVQLVKDLVNPSFLAFDRSGQFLYAVHGDKSEVSAFAADKTSGKLRFLNRQSTGGTNPVHLAADPNNRFLIIANYATGTVATLPINADGSLAPLAHLASLPGEPGPHKTQQGSSHPHHVPFDHSGRFVVVPDKGLDKIFLFRFDPSSGNLSPAEPPFVTAREGAGTRHIDFHPNLPYAYVMNELDSTVTAYRFAPERAEFKPLQIIPTTPVTYTGNNTGAEIAVAPSGKFVYGSNRGHDSIAIYAVDQTTGMLTSIGWESTQGKGPRFFTLDPSGNFLYAANENSDTIVTFRVSKETGKLNPTGQMIKTGSPVCIVFNNP